MDVILAIHERFARAILDGRKTRELRRRLLRIQPGDTVYVYATRPTGSVVGGFVAGDVTRDSPSRLWQMFAEEMHISRDEFDSYTLGAGECSALAVETVFRLRRPAPIAELRAIDPSFAAPQSASIVRSQALLDHLRSLVPKGTGAPFGVTA